MRSARSPRLPCRSTIGFLTLLLVVAVAAPLTAAAAADPGEGEKRYLVVFDAGVPEARGLGPAATDARREAISRVGEDLTERLAERGVDVDRRYDGSEHLAVTASPSQVRELESLPEVRAVVPDFELELTLNDSLAVIRAAPAQANDVTYTGSGQAIAIIDTGVDSDHTFFARPGGEHRIVAEACFADDGDCPNGETGPGAAAPLLVNGSRDSHGTHVAGIVAGWRESSTNPTHGVAPEADMLAVQAFSTTDSGGVYARGSDLLAALHWVYGQRHDHDIAAVNLSLGTTTAYSGTCDWVDSSGLFRDAVDDLRFAGAVTFAAAGNGSQRSAMSFPACLSNIVSVAASRNDDTVADYSNVSDATDLIAPGTGVRSSVVGGYASYSGTSMATPMVAGAAALLREASPSSSTTQLVGALRRSYTTIDDQRASGSVEDLPRLDLPAGFTGLGHGSTEPISAPSLTSSVGDLEVSLSWSESAPPNGGTVRYLLRRSSGSSCSSSSARIYRGTGTAFTDTGLTHDETYRYCAFATEGTDNASSASNTRKVTATDTSPPPAPSLSGSAKGARAELSWSKVSDLTGPISYRLHRSTGSSCSTSSKLVYSGTGRSFTDAEVDQDRTYRYCVTATDGAGNRSNLSNVVRLRVEDPLAGCFVLAGDWNRSGRDGIGWWCDGRAHLRAANGTVYNYGYGRSGDIPVAADWNGNGQDTVSVIRDGTWHVNNQLRSGAAERTFGYGRVSHGDTPMAGDWDSGGRDLPGIIRDREWHLRDQQSGGPADWRFAYGRLSHGDLPLWGDWNGDGRTTAGIVRKGEWHLRLVHAGGPADIDYVYGRVRHGDIPVVGDWNGDGMDTPAIVRDGVWHLKFTHGGGPADRTITFPPP